MAGQTDTTAAREVGRRHAPDFFVAALLAPAAARDDLIAVAALIGEIARIPAQVSEPMLAEIRLQWWRDALLAAATGVRTGHPVADAVAHTITRRRLDVGRLLAIVDAEDERGAAMAAFAVAAQIMKLSDGEELARTIAAAGEAYGSARELAFAAARGSPVQPTNRDEVRRALQAARAALRHAPAATVTAILPAALVEPYLRVSELAADGARRRLANLFPLKRVMRLWFARVTGRL